MRGSGIGGRLHQASGTSGFKPGGGFMGRLECDADLRRRIWLRWLRPVHDHHRCERPLPACKHCTRNGGRSGRLHRDGDKAGVFGSNQGEQCVDRAGTNTINTLATAPTLLGGDVVVDPLALGIWIGDLTALGNAFGTAVTPDTDPDVNGDGWVNIFDLTLAAGNFEKTSSLWAP